MKTLQKIGSCMFLFFTVLLFSTKSNAQIKAAFTANKSTISCPTETVYFSDKSTGNPQSWSWDFGDNTGSTSANPAHQFAKSGRYTVTLISKDALLQADTTTATIIVLGPTVQYTKAVDTTCSTLSIKFSSKATGIGPLTYSWDFGDGKTSTALTTSVTHMYKGGSSYNVNLTVKDTSGCAVKAGETLSFGRLAPVLASTPSTLIATRECTDKFGWTNYYADNNTPTDPKDDILLLSLYKDGTNIGTVGDGTFQVKVAATAKAGTAEAILLNSPVITNPSGYYVMNRYWLVEPTTQPAKPVGVRFYFNDQDVKDINGTFPTHDADFSQLIFYKTKNGNPDPSTNLQGASEIISIFPGSQADETNWTYSYIGAGSHAAEFAVTSFSGGGAGVTVNGATLPVKLISFNGKPENTGVMLRWIVASEINVERFDIEASADGRTFTTIGKVQAKGATTTTNEYSYNHVKVNAESIRFYKIVTVDKDGKKSYSEVIKVSFAGAMNDISLYPVPANNYINITSKSLINKACTVEVYNSLGLRVLQSNKTSSGNTFQLNTSSLPNGRYRTIIFSNNEKIGDGNFLIVR
jgi:chitodextrinase